LNGRLEFVLAVSVGASLFWLSFYFIWIGVHWVRWVSGGLGCLLGFAKLIWGLRDGSGILLVDGTMALVTGAYLALAPSVYFFAKRQREVVRWKESLIVAVVFALLLVSAGATIVGLQAYKAHLELRARAFAAQAFRAVFVDSDTDFLRSHATARLMNEEGWDRLSWFMADRYMQMGAARDLQTPHGNLRFFLRFPRTLVAEGVMTAEANGDNGPVRLHARIGGLGGNWEIDAISWRYLGRRAAPQP